MSLTNEDFTKLQLMIRSEVRDEMASAIEARIEPRLTYIEGELMANADDIKEIYKNLTHIGHRLGRVEIQVKDTNAQLTDVNDHLAYIDGRLEVIDSYLGIYKPSEKL